MVDSPDQMWAIPSSWPIPSWSQTSKFSRNQITLKVTKLELSNIVLLIKSKTETEFYRYTEKKN